MYIAPNSSIILCHDVPFSSDHQHTYLFANATQQYNYFRALAKYTLAEYSYQRAGLGRIRVGILADNLYDVNYMMFQNTSYGNRWFYCFVTKITYINDGCSELEYVIDPLQTWRFDWEIRQSFIERQHSVTDAIGDSITPENVQTGELVYNGWDNIFEANTTAGDETEPAVIVGVIDTASQPTACYRYDGVFQGAQLYAFDVSGAPLSTSLIANLTALKNMINNYVSNGQPDAIAFMYMCPKDAIIGTVSQSNDWTQHLITDQAIRSSKTATLTALTTNDTIDGYLPKNHKLYTYPYNMLIATNGCGASMTLRYELFDNLTPVFYRDDTFTQPVTLMLRPGHYKNSSQYAESITLSGYPSCSWTNDAFQAYIAQQSHNNIMWAGAGGLTNKVIDADIPFISEAAKKVSLLPSALAGGNFSIINPLSAITGLQSLYSAANQVDIVRGSSQNAGPLFAEGHLRFTYTRASLQAAKAKQIDDFFTRFGYAVNELGTPNLAARPAFTYVKTNAAFVCGGFDDATGAEISAILDNGVTFWQPGTTMADYSVNNAPV